LNNWTDELLALMVEKLVERKHRESDAIRGKPSTKKVSDTELFAAASNVIKVKNGD